MAHSPKLNIGSFTLCAVITALILSNLLSFCSYGFEFTDEAFYFVWISDPFLYDWSISQFGFVYHAIYKLTGGNIAALRQINIGLTFAFACVLVWVLLSLSDKNAPHRSVRKIVPATGFSIGALTTFQIGLFTPNYNSLTLKALIVTMIGLVLAERDTSPGSAAGWVLIGTGGWLCLMAKPSSAFVLAIAVAIYLAITHKLFTRMIWVAIGTAALLVTGSAVVIDGSIVKFAERLRTAIGFAGLLGGGYSVHTIFRLDKFWLEINDGLTIVFATAAAIAGGLLATSEAPIARRASAIIEVALAAMIIGLTFDYIELSRNLGEFRGLTILAVPLAAAGLLIASVAAGVAKPLDKQQAALAALLLIMPMVYAFGTNNNYWAAASHASFFWVACALVLVQPLSLLKEPFWGGAALLLMTQGITAMLLQGALNQPYRQPEPLKLNNSLTQVGTTNSRLVLADGFARYIDVAVAAARSAGLRPGMPVIDFTGQSPGVLYVLQAKSIGQAWIIGGYPGSGKLAASALGRVECGRIAESWVLDEPDGPRRIPLDVFSSFGSDLASDYQETASWYTAAGAGGFDSPRRQMLYRPNIPSSIEKSCIAKRTQNR